MLAVVAFHANANLLPGGFVGVDVFFVISGFLITSILHEGLASGTLSIGSFYAQRVKRLAPALAVMLAAVWATGWFTLLTDEYQQLGAHIVSGAAFVMNLTLWSEVGYSTTPRIPSRCCISGRSASKSSSTWCGRSCYVRAGAACL